MAPRFTRFEPAALTFLRALKRNNDRDWFRARKEEYERLLRAPMAALVERLAGDLRTFAPGLVADPKRSMFRIYRDTRFSADKRPLKTNVAAVFPPRDLPKHSGAGLYLEVAPGWVWIGGGLYAPDTSHLQLVREHIAANPRRLRAIVEAPAFHRAAGKLYGDSLRRMPRGFPPDHEAAAHLRQKQFLASREFPAALATSPRFYATILSVFRPIAPLIAFLNEPLVAGPRPHVFTGGR